MAKTVRNRKAYGEGPVEIEPFQPHPDGRLVPVQRVPYLDASELAWSGIIDHGVDGDMRPFDELREYSYWLAECTYDTPVLRLDRLTRLEESDNRVRLQTSLSSWNPDRPECVSDGEWREFTLVSTRPHFGGRRWWFECPACKVRRAYIYLVPCLYSLCRECLGLTYESRQEYNWTSRHGRGYRNFKYRMDSILNAAEQLDRGRKRRRFRRERQST